MLALQQVEHLLYGLFSKQTVSVTVLVQVVKVEKNNEVIKRSEGKRMLKVAIAFPTKKHIS